MSWVRLIPLVLTIGASVVLVASGDGTLALIALVVVAIAWTLSVRRQAG